MSKHKDKLIAAQKEYINFLGDDISKNAVYLEIHGQGATKEIAEKGALLRNKIQKALYKLEVEEVKDEKNKTN